MINLGFEGEQITVILASGSDYVVTLLASEDWPADLAITLALSADRGSAVVWSADVAGSEATFSVPAAEVQAVIDAGLSYSRLYYHPAGSGPLLWGQGGIRVV